MLINIINLSIFGLLLFFVSCKSQTEPNTKTKAGVSVETKAQDIDYLALGDSITDIAFAQLSSRLKSVIDTGGFLAAVNYCSIEAMPLTKKVADTYGVEISRVTDKNRNPLNKASKADLAILNGFAQSQTGGAVIDPEKGNETVYYRPIYTQGLCLNCHGTVGQELQENLFEAIKIKYPNDLAINYSTGELRGAWKVRFTK